MSQVKNLPQREEALLRSYNKQIKDDIKSMVDNFTEIIKLAKFTCEEDDRNIIHSLSTLQSQHEMSVRAHNIVRAGESLMKLISEIKQYLVLNDFPSVNDALSQDAKHCRRVTGTIDLRLAALRDDIAVELYELEDEYYSSLHKLMPAISPDLFDL